MNHFTKITASLMLTTAAFLGAAANADEAVLSKTVNFADLNVSTDQGAATLYKRIHFAAISVCPGDSMDRNLQRISLRSSCITASEARAVRSLNSPALSAYYSAKTGHVVANLAANSAQ